MTIYVKSNTWAGKTRWYVGLQASNPDADPCHKLGSYFIACSSRDAALAIAEHEARRMATNVVECPHYVAL